METLIDIQMIEPVIISKDDHDALERNMALFLKNELTPIKVKYDFGRLRVIDDRDERVKFAAAQKCGARILRVIVIDD